MSSPGKSSSSERGSTTAPERPWFPISPPFSITITASSGPAARRELPQAGSRRRDSPGRRRRRGRRPRGVSRSAMTARLLLAADASPQCRRRPRPGASRSARPTAASARRLEGQGARRRTPHQHEPERQCAAERRASRARRRRRPPRDAAFAPPPSPAARPRTPASTPGAGSPASATRVGDRPREARCAGRPRRLRTGRSPAASWSSCRSIESANVRSRLAVEDRLALRGSCRRARSCG